MLMWGFSAAQTELSHHHQCRDPSEIVTALEIDGGPATAAAE